MKNLNIKRWLKEPLLHFVLFGALIFAVNAWRAALAGKGFVSPTVHLDEAS